MSVQNHPKSKHQKPISDTSSECGALACVIQSSDAKDKLDQLAEPDFYDERNLTIFRALLNLAEDGESLDATALFLRLKSREEIDPAGGADYVVALPESAPSVAHWPSFLRSVKEFSKRRAMIADAEQALKRARDTSIPLTVTIPETLRARIVGRFFSDGIEIPEPPVVFSLARTGICTAGNLTTISAQAKAGKTATVGAMIASVLAESPGDFLGFESAIPRGKALVHLDTEQTRFDHAELIRRAMRRADVKRAPAWLRSACVTDFSLRELRESIRISLDDAAQKFGGIHSFILDGVADCVTDVNDPQEANEFVAELHALAMRYNAPFILIIHLNPSSDTKTRGHLGSQLERKAESNLKLKKSDEITTLFCDKNRRAPIPEPTAPRFAWDSEAGMHMSLPSSGQSKASARKSELVEIRDEVFRLADACALTWSDFVAALARVPGISSTRKAERVFGELKSMGLIRKDLLKRYEPAQ